jgi:hypothetical protein
MRLVIGFDDSNGTSCDGFHDRFAHDRLTQVIDGTRLLSSIESTTFYEVSLKFRGLTLTIGDRRFGTNKDSPGD